VRLNFQDTRPLFPLIQSALIRDWPVSLRSASLHYEFLYDVTTIYGFDEYTNTKGDFLYVQDQHGKFDKNFSDQAFRM